MLKLWKIIFAVCIGAVGGWIFWQLNLSLPWMLGSLIATLLASLAGLPIEGPKKVRPIVVAVIGVLLGSSFSPEVFSQIFTWAGTLSFLLLYVVLVAALIVPFYRYVGGYDLVTSYFSAMPGGLAEMIELGEAKGADVRAVVLAHMWRIVLTITCIAIWFRVVLGHEVGANTTFASNWLEWEEALLLVAAAVAGAIIGKLLRLPAPFFLGAMLVSAILHLFGFSEAAPPPVVVAIAQVFLGTTLGCQFRGVPLKLLRQSAVLSSGATVISLSLALLFATILAYVFAIDPVQTLLAFAPGGLTEMGLIAMAVNADVAFVALHHVVRILMMIIGAPLCFALIETRGRRKP